MNAPGHESDQALDRIDSKADNESVTGHQCRYLPVKTRPCKYGAKQLQECSECGRTRQRLI